MRQFGKTNDILFLEFACRFQNELLLMSSQLILLFMNDCHTMLVYCGEEDEW